MGLTREQFRERMEWIEEELQDELDDDDYALPIDEEGAEILFIPASLELMKYPGSIQACCKILRAAGARQFLGQMLKMGELRGRRLHASEPDARLRDESLGACSSPAWASCAK